MKPMATACHSGSHGSGLSRSSRRITRHRISRIGNVNVASATVSTRRRGSTARRPASTSLHCVPRTAHAKKATVTARPRIQAQREGEGEADARLGAGLEGEGNEVADFVDERAELVARHPLRRFPQLLRSLERTVAAIQQGAHVHGGRRGSRYGGAGSRGCGRTLDAGDELRERRRADPSFQQTLVSGPRPDQVGSWSAYQRLLEGGIGSASLAELIAGVQSAPAAPAPGSPVAAPAAPAVDVRALLYRGDRALQRAKELREAAKRVSGDELRALVDEVCDLVALALEPSP